MSDMMTFPDTVEEFMEQYKIVDTKQVYTNGTELVPIFRMKQWFEHLQTIEPERKIGTWEPVEEIPSIRKRFKRYCCSNCKKEGFDTWNFCPECGQRNRGEGEN